MEQTPQMRPVWEDNFNILKKSKKKEGLCLEELD
jgi:hypothetical protein